MSGKEGIVSEQDVERSQKLHQFMNPQQQQLNTPNTDTTTTTNNHGASSSGVAHRRRGRPAGSKNKPKMPSIITHDNSNALSSHVIEITAGSEVLKILFDYAHHTGKVICILSGNGVVEDVTLRQSAGSNLTLKGRFDILSISGTIFPSPTSASVGGLAIHLSETTGEVIGGHVIHPLVALGTIKLTVVSFKNIGYEKLCSAGYGQEEHESSSLDAARHVVEGDGGFSNVGGSISGMRNMMSSNINHPSSSATIRLFGRDITENLPPNPPHI